MPKNNMKEKSHKHKAGKTINLKGLKRSTQKSNLDSVKKLPKYLKKEILKYRGTDE